VDDRVAVFGLAADDGAAVDEVEHVLVANGAPDVGAEQPSDDRPLLRESACAARSTEST
jgi:hypothetical protein